MTATRCGEGINSVNKCRALFSYYRFSKEKKKKKKKKTKRVVQKYIKPSSYILRIYRWCYRYKMVVANCSLGGEGTVFY